MTKILVAGSNGQLGNELQIAAKAFPQFSFIFTDIEELNIAKSGDVAAFLDKHQPNYIINTAGYTAVDKAEEERHHAMLANAVAVGNLVTSALTIGAYLLHISTDYVFDGKKTTPYVETDAVNPISVYGETKLKGEEMILSYQRGLIIRTAWLYSSFGNNFVKTMLRLSTEKSELRVVNDQIGTPTYAADLALALLQIIEKSSLQPRGFINGIFHYANEGVCTWFDFAQKIMDFGNRLTVVKPCTTADYPTKATRPPYSVLSKEKIKQAYGITIPTWENALKRCLKVLNEK